MRITSSIIYPKAIVQMFFYLTTKLRIFDYKPIKNDC